MDVKPYGSRRLHEVTIPTQRARGLETSIAIDGQTIWFRRPGVVDAIGPYDVVVAWANREADATSGTTDVTTADGELHGRPDWFDVQAGDLFAIDEQTAELVEPIITDRGVRRAPFRLMAGRGE